MDDEGPFTAMNKKADTVGICTGPKLYLFSCIGYIFT